MSNFWCISPKFPSFSILRGGPVRRRQYSTSKYFVGATAVLQISDRMSMTREGTENSEKAGHDKQRDDSWIEGDLCSPLDEDSAGVEICLQIIEGYARIYGQ